LIQTILKKGQNVLRRQIISIIILIAVSIFIFFHFEVGRMMVTEFSYAQKSLVAFLMMLVFVFLVDNTRLFVKRDLILANTVPAMLIILWIGPYTAAVIITVISLFRINNPQSYKSQTPMIIRILRRASVYFLMYTIPAFFVYTPMSFSIRLFLYFLLAIVINHLIMVYYFPLMTGKFHIDLKRNTIIFLVELIPPVALLPISKAIYELNIAGYSGIVKLYHIFPFVSIMLLLLTWAINKTTEEKEERKRLMYFKKALKGTLSALKLVRSTEDFNLIMNKATRLLAEVLGYQEALISVINRKERKIKRIDSFGISDTQFREYREQELSIIEIDKLFDRRFEFAGTYFIPSESGLYNELEPEKALITDKSEEKDKWHDNDLFLVPFLNSENQLIGYISLDNPNNNMRPTEEEAEIARIFAEQIGRMLETSVKYKEAMDKTKMDMMTGLANHTHFYEIIEQMIKKSTYEDPLSLVLFDIDDFKQLNDQYGHITGDNVLITVAKIIKHSIPENALAARYGGEEFALLMPGKSKFRAVEIANEIIKKIRKTPIEGISVSISGGVSTCPEDGTHHSSLVSAADSALYISKKTGKDKVTMV